MRGIGPALIAIGISLCAGGAAGPAEVDSAEPAAVAPSAAAVDHLAIEGETKVEPYKLVRLSSSIKQANDPASKKPLFAFDWEVSPWADASVFDVGDQCVFAGPPGSYQVVLKVIDWDKREQHKARATVVIGKPGPTPPPVPPPDPTPPPVPPPTPTPTPLPDGTFKLAQLSFDLAMAHVQLAAAERKGTAGKLAGSHRAVAAQIAAGTLNTAAQILAASRTANREALGAQKDAWIVWSSKLGEKLESLSTSGALRTADQFKTAWLEIATGLEAVK